MATIAEINKKYMLDADRFEVWGWANGSKTPIKFPYADKNVNKEKIIGEVSRKSDGGKVDMVWLMKNGKQFMRIK